MLGRTARSMPSSATREPKCLTSPSARIAGAATFGLAGSDIAVGTGNYSSLRRGMAQGSAASLMRFCAVDTKYMPDTVASAGSAADTACSSSISRTTMNWRPTGHFDLHAYQ